MFRRLTTLALCASLALPALAPSAGAQQASAPPDVGPSLSDRASALRADPDRNPFETGMILSLAALEKLAQLQYRHGAANAMMPGIPRLGMPNLRNRAPQPLTAETLREALETLSADLEEARAILQSAEGAPFVLDLNGLWVDIDGSGSFDPEVEHVTRVLGPMITGRRALRRTAPAPDLPGIRFDASDRLWLMAYTHMLQGGAELGLAFDPGPVIGALNEARKSLKTLPEKPYIWDVAELEAEMARLKLEAEAIKQQIDDLHQQLQPFMTTYRDMNTYPKDLTSEERKTRQQAAREYHKENIRPLQDEQNRLRRSERALRAERRAVEAKLPPKPDRDSLRAEMLREMGRADLTGEMRPRYAAFIDMLYILIETFDQTPDAAHLQAARQHFLTMITLNRLFWAANDLETDDDREWIPNARQTGTILPDLDPRAGETWMKLLGDAELVLNGDLLIPHPLLPQGTGIDLAAYIDNPAPLDLAGWVQGVSAYPYTARGPRITQQYWQQFTRITGGRAALFAFYFN